MMLFVFFCHLYLPWGLKGGVLGKFAGIPGRR